MKGLFPILATPFDGADRIDEEDLRREVDFVIELGAHGVGIAFASEVVKLSEAERDVATRTVVEQAGGKGARPVVVNTGAPSTAVTVQYSSAPRNSGRTPRWSRRRWACRRRSRRSITAGCRTRRRYRSSSRTCRRRRCRPRWRGRWPARSRACSTSRRRTRRHRRASRGS